MNLLGAVFILVMQEPSSEARSALAPVTPEPEQVWPRGTRVPAQQALDEAVAWLVANQNQDGSWGSHRSPRPIEVLASFPGSQEAFRVATSALCVIALSDARLGLEEANPTLERGLDFVLAHFDVKRQSGLEHYNVWTFGFGLQCLGEHLQRHPQDPRAADMRATCERIVERLGQYQTLDGGWGYLSISGVPTFRPSDTSMSFTTATILVGLDAARKAGVTVPEQLLARAVSEVERSRLADDAFLYGDYLKYRPRMGINATFGSACRTPLCLHVLELYGRKIEQRSHLAGLENLLVTARDYQKASVRRPIPHEAWYNISGYFYLYGHAYAAYVLEHMPSDAQQRYWPLMVDAVQYCRQPDGSYWDYPLYSYHKPYGTAFAIIALARAVRAGVK